MLEQASVILAVTSVFESLGIRYYLGGSWASGAVGIARMTEDVDFCAELSDRHAQPLAAAFTPDFYIDAGMIRSALRNSQPFNIIHLKYLYKVDIFPAGKSPYQRARMERRVLRPIDLDSQLRVYFCSAEDIIIEKLRWYRLGEGVSERQWRDVLGVLKVQQPYLDYAYLRRWAADQDLADLLEQAMDEAFDSE